VHVWPLIREVLDSAQHRIAFGADFRFASIYRAPVLPDMPEADCRDFCREGWALFCQPLKLLAVTLAKICTVDRFACYALIENIRKAGRVCQIVIEQFYQEGANAHDLKGRLE